MLSASGGSISLTTDSGGANEQTITLDTDGTYDRTGFTGSSDLTNDGEGQILSIAEGASTFAAFVLDRDEGVTAESYFGRTAASSSLPSGTATLTGTYVGAIIETPDITRGYVDGDVTIDVDLNNLTIAGTIENVVNTAEEFDTVQDAEDIILPEIAIATNGTFEGSGSRTISDTESEQTTTVTTDWSGLIGGSSLSDLEAVGAVETTTVATGGATGTQTQSGVFFAD